MLKRTCLIASLLAATALSPALAAPHGVKIGILSCNVQSGWGYVFGSSKDVACTYHPNRGDTDRYVGSISKFGLDIGYTSSGTLVWDVIAPTSDMRSGALSGDYGGATASATVAAGIGAHVLFGGFDKSIALQPLSFESSSGLDVAAGIGELELRAAPPPPAPAPAPAAYVAPPVPTPAPERQVRSYMLTFRFDQASLTPRDRDVIRDVAEYSDRSRPVRILVTGHADHVGTAAYNWRLSLDRAEAVKAELVRDGVDDRLVYVAGRGFEDPEVPTGPGVRERANRQVVIEVRGGGDTVQASR